MMQLLSGCCSCSSSDGQGIPAVVASLARNTERHKVMQQRLKAVGANFQFVDAIDAQQQLMSGQVRALMTAYRHLLGLAYWRPSKSSRVIAFMSLSMRLAKDVAAGMQSGCAMQMPLGWRVCNGTCTACCTPWDSAWRFIPGCKWLL